MLSRVCLGALTAGSGRGLTKARWLSGIPRPKPQTEQTSANKNQDDSSASNSQTAPNDSTPPSAGASVPTLSLDFSQDDAQASSTVGRTGAKSSKDSLSSIEKKRKAMSRFALAVFGVGLLTGVVFMGREWESYERPDLTKDELNEGRWGRTKTRLGQTTDVFSKPQWKELLPPLQPPPHQKPYTLLLSLDDLLITSVWDRQQGWRTAKRPGVDYFLAYLSQFYEIVIFTTQPHYTALPVVDLLDRYRFFIMYHLFRESTRVADGKIVKDLQYLNRDLSKVILLDTHPDHIYTHPENSILMKPWKGDIAEGKGLVGLIPFLESIAFFAPADVRPILTAYAGRDIAVEYAKHEAREKEKYLQEWRQKGGTKRGASNFTFSNLFTAPQFAKSDEPLTFLEQKRREAQLFYKREQEYIAENMNVLEKARQEEIDKMKETQGSLVGWFESMNGKKPEEESHKIPISDKPLPLVGSHAPDTQMKS